MADNGLRPLRSALAEARAWIGAQLDTWQMAFVTELVVSELVINAIRYGAPPIQLRMSRSDALICEVSDGSSAAPHLRRARVLDEGGRGLMLSAQLTDHWGVCRFFVSRGLPTTPKGS